MPGPIRPICLAAPRDKSISLPLVPGNRSLIRTITLFPVEINVTLTRVSQPQPLWAAVRASWSKRSPQAVRLPSKPAPYHDATPEAVAPTAGMARVGFAAGPRGFGLDPHAGIGNESANASHAAQGSLIDTVYGQPAAPGRRAGQRRRDLAFAFALALGLLALALAFAFGSAFFAFALTFGFALVFFFAGLAASGSALAPVMS